MLFDLRSRGRRQTVRVVYAFLAIIMVVGLVGLGIGTGSSGGILNAGGNGGGGGGSSLSNQALKKAITAVKKNPTAANWASLMQARWTAAGSGSNYNSSTSTYTAGGKKQLQYGADAWQKYVKLVNPKSGGTFLQNSFLAADIYQNLQQWSSEAEAWNFAAQATSGPSRVKPYLCWAYSAYAAKETTTGDLAAAQAIKLLPRLQRLTQKSALTSASTSVSQAVSGLVQNC
jgi:hypothetical protein